MMCQVQGSNQATEWMWHVAMTMHFALIILIQRWQSDDIVSLLAGDVWCWLTLRQVQKKVHIQAIVIKAFSRHCWEKIKHINLKDIRFQKYLYFSNKRDFFSKSPQPLWKFQLLSFIHFFKCLALGELLTHQKISMPLVGRIWIFSGTIQCVKRIKMNLDENTYYSIFKNLIIYLFPQTYSSSKLQVLAVIKKKIKKLWVKWILP